MTRISKVRSIIIIIIITISNPSEAITDRCFHVQVDVRSIVYRLPVHVQEYYDVRCVRLLTSAVRCSTAHDAFIPIR